MNSTSIVIRNFIGRYSQINWALLDQAMVSGVNFLTGIILVRFLGLEEFGRFTLTWLIILFFNSIQFSAVISPMMSIGPKQAEKELQQYYGAVFSQQLLWSGLCVISIFSCTWGSQFFVDWQIHKLAVPLGATLLAVQSQDFLRRYFFVRERAALAFANDSISYLGRLLLLVVFFKFRILDINEVLWLIACSSGLATVIGYFKTERLIYHRTYVYKMLKKHWHFSKWLIVSALLQWTSGNFFLVAAGSILGVFAVGAIKAAQNIIGITHILFQAMENFVPSKAANAFTKEGAPGLLKYLRGISWYGGLFIAAIAFFAAIFSDFWFKCVYGNEFLNYSYLLKWFSLIYFAGFFVIPLSAGLRAIEKTKSLFSSFFLMSLVSVLLAYPLVTYFGLNGVMVGILSVKLGILIYIGNDFKKNLKQFL
jgi:O-antigen/teichoic acid export membrane protein